MVQQADRRSEVEVRNRLLSIDFSKVRFEFAFFAEGLLPPMLNRSISEVRSFADGKDYLTPYGINYFREKKGKRGCCKLARR